MLPATYPLQSHASFNTKTEYILALPLNLQAGMKRIGGGGGVGEGKNELKSSVSQNEFVVFPFMGAP